MFIQKKDCLVKVWTLSNESTEPLVTLREHTGPLFAVSASASANKEPVFFTGGSEGLIKMWGYPNNISIEELAYKWLPISTSFGHEDIIWDFFIEENRVFFNKIRTIWFLVDLTLSANSGVFQWKIVYVEIIKKWIRKEFLRANIQFQKIFRPVLRFSRIIYIFIISTAKVYKFSIWKQF